MGQEFGHSLAESSGSRSLTRLSIKISLGAAVSQDSTVEGFRSLGAVGLRPQFQMSCLARGFFQFFFFFLLDVLLSVR